MGQSGGKAQAQRIENLNSAASGLYHKKDYFCQVANNKLGQMGIKKPPQLMFEVVGVWAVRKLNS